MSEPRRWWEMPNLFDLFGGPFLDKKVLQETGVRTGSIRRWVVAALVVRLFALPLPNRWEEVALWGLAVLGPDLQNAVTAAPQAAVTALGQAIGAAGAAARSGYHSARSTFLPTNPPPPDNDTPEAS